MVYVIYTVHLLYYEWNIMNIMNTERSRIFLIIGIIIQNRQNSIRLLISSILFLIIPHYFSGDFSSFWRIDCLSIKISCILTSKNVLRKTHKKYH